MSYASNLKKGLAPSTVARLSGFSKPSSSTANGVYVSRLSAQRIAKPANANESLVTIDFVMENQLRLVSGSKTPLLKRSALVDHLASALLSLFNEFGTFYGNVGSAQILTKLFNFQELEKAEIDINEAKRLTSTISHQVFDHFLPLLNLVGDCNLQSLRDRVREHAHTSSITDEEILRFIEVYDRREIQAQVTERLNKMNVFLDRVNGMGQSDARLHSLKIEGDYDDKVFEQIFQACIDSGHWGKATHEELKLMSDELTIVASNPERFEKMKNVISRAGSEVKMQWGAIMTTASAMIEDMRDDEVKANPSDGMESEDLGRAISDAISMNITELNSDCPTCMTYELIGLIAKNGPRIALARTIASITPGVEYFMAVFNEIKAARTSDEDGEWRIVNLDHEREKIIYSMCKAQDKYEQEKETRFHDGKLCYLIQGRINRDGVYSMVGSRILSMTRALQSSGVVGVMISLYGMEQGSLSQRQIAIPNVGHGNVTCDQSIAVPVNRSHIVKSTRQQQPFARIFLTDTETNCAVAPPFEVLTSFVKAANEALNREGIDVMFTPSINGSSAMLACGNGDCFTHADFKKGSSKLDDVMRAKTLLESPEVVNRICAGTLSRVLSKYVRGGSFKLQMTMNFIAVVIVHAAVVFKVNYDIQPTAVKSVKIKNPETEITVNLSELIKRETGESSDEDGYSELLKR